MSISGQKRPAKEQYSNIFPGNPFDYFFLDNFFNRQYQADRQVGQVFGFFALLAIFVASLGLFGLASFTAVQRTKEIGILPTEIFVTLQISSSIQYVK